MVQICRVTAADFSVRNRSAHAPPQVVAHRKWSVHDVVVEPGQAAGEVLGPPLSATRASPTSSSGNPLAARGLDDEPDPPDSGVDVRSTSPQRWLPVRP